MQDDFWVLNAIAGIATIFFLISVPRQIYRRFKKKRNGELVSPMELIIKKTLKYWLITAVVLISVVSMEVSMYLKSIGAPNQAVTSAVVEVVLGNILTSLVIGYALMVAFKDRWSYSANQWNFKKINNLK